MDRSGLLRPLSSGSDLSGSLALIRRGAQSSGELLHALYLVWGSSGLTHMPLDSKFDSLEEGRQAPRAPLTSSRACSPLASAGRLL